MENKHEDEVAGPSCSDLRRCSTETGRCSTETVLSIQGKETDFVCDTSDTEWLSSDGDAGLEFEPVSEPDDDGPFTGDSSGHSENEIIATKVIEVSVGDDAELQLADSEPMASSCDSENDWHHYRLCAHCRAENNDPHYRYCEKCFKERKDFFPSRPKRKRKRNRSPRVGPVPLPSTLSQDSGAKKEATKGQELSQNSAPSGSQSSVTECFISNSQTSVSESVIASSQNSVTENVITSSKASSNSLIITHFKRRAESADRYSKRSKIDYSDCESDSDCSNNVSFIKTDISASISNTDVSLKEELTSKNSTEVKTVETNINTDGPILNGIQVRPVDKMVSDSESHIDRSKSKTITVENTDVKLTKKVIANTTKEKLDNDAKDLCIVCLAEPKSGVFLHGRIAHICCCYKCAVKVWSKTKRCPLCNRKVSNVLKVM